MSQKPHSDESLEKFLIFHTRKSLSGWLYVTYALLTLLILAWISLIHLQNRASTEQVINSILANRSNTFTEMFIQRDIEQFVASKSESGLFRMSIGVSRSGIPLAFVGEEPWLGIAHHWEVETIGSSKPYQISFTTSYLPVFIFYLLSLIVIFFVFRLMMKVSMTNFKKSFEVVSASMDEVIQELQGQARGTSENRFHEINLLRFLSDKWKAQLDTYRTEVEKLSQAQLESRMAQQVAHDIRSPLSVLNILSQIRRNLTSEDQEILAAACKRIEAIVDGLNTIAAQQVQRSAKKFLVRDDLRDIWSSLVREKKIEYKNSNVAFDFYEEWEENDRIAIGDQVQLERTISNLINNSVAAASDHQSLKVRLSLLKQIDSIGFEIRDNGRGIPENIRAKLGSAPISDTGTGLGISSAFNWVNRESGKIEIDSSSGGTSLRFIWPNSI